MEARAAALAARVELHLDREHEPVDVRAQRADVAGEPLGQHRDRAVREVHAVAAAQRLAVDRRARRDPVRDVRDRDPQPRSRRARRLDAHRVVVVARGRGIDRDERAVAQIGAARELARVGLAQRFDLRERLVRKFHGQPMAPHDRREVGVRIAGPAEPLDDAHPGRSLALRLALPPLGRHRAHDLAGPRAARVAARDAQPPVAVVAIRRDADHLVLLVPAQDADPVIARAADHLEQLGAAARERRDQHAIARARLAGVVDAVLAPPSSRARAARRRSSASSRPSARGTRQPPPARARPGRSLSSWRNMRRSARSSWCSAPSTRSSCAARHARRARARRAHRRRASRVEPRRARAALRASRARPRSRRFAGQRGRPISSNVR